MDSCAASLIPGTLLLQRMEHSAYLHTHRPNVAESSSGVRKEGLRCCRSRAFRSPLRTEVGRGGWTLELFLEGALVRAVVGKLVPEDGHLSFRF